MKQLPPIVGGPFIHGYWAGARGRRLTEMTEPAVNMFVDSSGSAYTRPGLEDTTWDLNNASKAAEPLWISEYNVSFYAFSDSVKVVDHENGNTVINLSVTLTAESTLSYYNGCVYVTNTTDGAYRIAVSRLWSNVSASATSIPVEPGTTFRFESTGSVRINGTAETYTSLDSSNWELDGANASQGYSAGALITQATALSIPKLKKIVFWKESMNGFGPQTATGAQAAKRIHFFGDFFDATNWKTVEDFSGGSSGEEGVGSSGEITNELEVQDYLYLFTDRKTYSISTADVNLLDGSRPPNLFSPKYGSLNHKTAADMDGRVVFLTQNRRIIRSAVSPNGRLEPDEHFDAPVSKLLKLMDDSQPHALMFYWEEANYLLCQLSVGGQLTTLVYDNNPITTEKGSTEGRWLPPVLNWQVKNYFTIDGKLYGTDITDDTVFQFAIGESDDGGDIESVWAAGVLEVTEGRTLCDWNDFEVSGGLTRGSEAVFAPYVSEVPGKEKTISSAGLDFGSSVAMGSVRVGNSFTPGSGTGAVFANFDESRKVIPAKGRSFQPVLRCEGDGQAMRVDSWRLPKVKFYKTSALTTS